MPSKIATVFTYVGENESGHAKYAMASNKTVILTLYPQLLSNGTQLDRFFHSPTNRQLLTQNNSNFATDSQNQRWIYLHKCFEKKEGVVLYPINFIDSQGRQWKFLGKGNFNLAYRLVNEDGSDGDLVYKINIFSNKECPSDNPERAVQIWNQINNKSELKATRYEDGWILPYIEGKAPTDAVKVCKTIIEIYKRTGRIIPDAYVYNLNPEEQFSFMNFVETPEGELICIDIGAAVRLDKDLQLSVTSLNFSTTMKEDYDIAFKERLNSRHGKDEGLQLIIKTVKALLYVELFNLELRDPGSTLKNQQYIDLFAEAYDTSNPNITISSALLLTKDEIETRNKTNDSDEPTDTQTRKFRVLHELFQLGLSEETARPLARNYYFTYLHLDALKFLIREEKQPPEDALNEILFLSPNEATLLITLYDVGLRSEHLIRLRSSFDIPLTPAIEKKLTAGLRGENPDIETLIGEIIRSSFDEKSADTESSAKLPTNTEENNRYQPSLWKNTPPKDDIQESTRSAPCR